MIGIFDSGIGGISLYLKAKEKMPDKGFIYLSDDSNFPYGEKSEDELLGLVRKNIKLLQGMSANVVLIACNSATVSSRGRIRKEFDIPIIGVEPGIKVAHDKFAGKRAMVLATERTAKTHAESKKDEYQNVKIIGANGLVKLVEQRFPDIQKDELRAILDSKIKDEEVVVLGCTHYHLIHNLLEEIYPDKTFIAPEEAIVKQTEKFASTSDNSPEDIFLTSGDIAHFKVKLEAVLGRKCDVRKV